ncbi:MAG: hypothetical protein IOD12_06050 [Silvanigrellales bacterium]|jgi:aspartyl-tRNA(Asn)/glutamyl-tRNA(Gln) amidotransferase subunit C|nr:hypothetical protein [Silvanigrellales bacterium]
METLPSQTVARLARTARLELTPEELERSGHDLQKILAAFESLSTFVPREGSQGPADTVRLNEGSEARGTSRPDNVLNALDKAAFLAQAPDSDGVYVRVPLILGGGS